MQMIGRLCKMVYEEKDIATYHTNGVMELISGKWLILNDETMYEINQILLRCANDETNRRKVKES